MVRLDLDGLVGQDGDVLHLMVADKARPELEDRLEPRHLTRGHEAPVTVVAGIPVTAVDLEEGPA